MARLTLAEALRQAIREEMQRDENVYCIGEDIGIPGGWGGAFTVTLGLEKEFPDRIINTPISEAGFFGVALGSSLKGLRPIVDVQYGDFLFCAMDQIANQIAKLRYMSGGKLKTPVVMRAPVGFTGRGAQHSQMLEPFFQCLPGIKILVPATAYDAKGLLKSAVRDDNPVLIFEHKLLYGAKGARTEPGSVDASSEIPDEEYTIPIGKGIVRRQGTDVTIIATLLMMHRACEAAEMLEKENIKAEIIDPRCLVPFDWEIVKESISKTGRIVIVEESPRNGGVGAEIAAKVAEEMLDYLIAPVKRVAAPDTPAPFSPALEKFYVSDAEKIVKAVKEIINISS